MTKEWSAPHIKLRAKFVDDRQPGEEWPISSKRYRILGKAGQGAWGTVYAAEDTAAGDLVALKRLTPSQTAQEQMHARGLTEREVMQKESGRFVDTTNVVPRVLEFDDKGEAIIRMPIYPRTLGEAINSEDGRRLRFEDGLTPETTFNWMRGIAHGIHETQTKYGRVHPDLSEGNVMLDDTDKPLVNDFGSATVITLHGTSSPRDNIGAIATRAYECFGKGSHPDRRTNSYAVGAMAYRLMTGEYPWEKELDNAKDPVKYMQDLDPKVADTAINRKIKRNIPRPLRKFFRKTLAHDPSKRPQNGEELEKELNRSIVAYERSQPLSRLKRWGLAAVLSLAIGGGGFGAYSSMTAEERVSNAEERAQETEERYEYRKKTEMIREYLGDRRQNTVESVLAKREIAEWVEILGDEKSGFAAYLNPDAVYEAVQHSGGKQEWEEIKDLVEEIDYTVYSQIQFSTPGEFIDNWMYSAPNYSENRVRERWAAVKRNYDSRAAEERRHRLDTSGMFGPIFPNGAEDYMSKREKDYFEQGAPPRELGSLSTNGE